MSKFRLVTFPNGATVDVEVDGNVNNPLFKREMAELEKDAIADYLLYVSHGLTDMEACQIVSEDILEALNEAQGTKEPL